MTRELKFKRHFSQNIAYPGKDINFWYFIRINNSERHTEFVLIAQIIEYCDLYSDIKQIVAAVLIYLSSIISEELCLHKNSNTKQNVQYIQSFTEQLCIFYNF